MCPAKTWGGGCGSYPSDSKNKREQGKERLLHPRISLWRMARDVRRPYPGLG